MTNSAIIGFIKDAQDGLAKIDDMSREIGGLYWGAARIFVMDSTEAGWIPHRNEDGSLAMLITNEDFANSGIYEITVQEFGEAFLGSIQLMMSIPDELAVLIARVRTARNEI